MLLVESCLVSPIPEKVPLLPEKVSPLTREPLCWTISTELWFRTYGFYSYGINKPLYPFLQNQKQILIIREQMDEDFLLVSFFFF